ncbi:MAG: hypothetical protein IPL40_01770 [Proteobacteria bacterium]|nr:hypothetical protein [Pseudomonadota bacterium]
MNAASWRDQERGLRALGFELRRLRRRAVLRPWTIVLLSIGATGGAVVRQALERGRYQASLTYRVIEHTQGPEGEARPVTKRRLRDYVSDGIFTRGRCRQVVEQFGLFPELQQLSVHRAVDALRDELVVEVFQNYFLKEDLDTSAPRSARLRITFSYFDIGQAEKVVRALGTIIVAHEAQARAEIAEQLDRTSALAERRAAAKLDALRHQRAAVQYELTQGDSAGSGARRIALAQLDQAIARADMRLERLRDDSSVGDLRTRLERRGMLLHFDLVDWSRSAEDELPRNARLALIGVFCFLFLLPVVGLAVAAFDARVYGEEDIRRLGLEPLGHVPSFAADELGTLSERLPGR